MTRGRIPAIVATRSRFACTRHEWTLSACEFLARKSVRGYCRVQSKLREGSEWRSTWPRIRLGVLSASRISTARRSGAITSPAARSEIDPNPPLQSPQADMTNVAGNMRFIESQFETAQNEIEELRERVRELERANNILRRKVEDASRALGGKMP